MKKITKCDILLITFIVVINCIFLILGGQRVTGLGVAEVLIYVDGELAGDYVIGRGYTDEFIINSDSGYNAIRTEDGYVWVEDSDCPDQLCMRQGRISSVGQVIICLPHKLAVKVTGTTGGNVDAVSQ